jgi:NAD(P)-dependent dehydrogenase (short-subunit alcohol dehydrogenase family)
MVFGAGGADPAVMRAKLEAEVPMGRIGSVADVAAMAALLVSPRGRYTTGAAIAVDGGLLRGVR